VTDLQIVNRALKRINSLPAATMADTDRNQAYAIEQYPFARDEILRLFAWPSVIARAMLLDIDDLRCQWILSHVYHVGDYVTNDTGKVYQCITAGTSAAAGGPTGTSANITDGTVHWKYVGANDTTVNWAWRASHAYVVGDVVANQDGMIFYCITAGTTAATGGPTTVSADITDNTAHWCYYATAGANLTIYMFHYLYPPAALRLLKMPANSAASEGAKGAMYLREGNFIFTDVEEAEAKYIQSCTASTDPSRWDTLLQATVVIRLACMIAFFVTGKMEVQNSVDAEFARTARFARDVAIFEGSEGVPEPALWEDA